MRRAWRLARCVKRILVLLTGYVLLVALMTTAAVVLGIRGADELVLTLTPRFVHFPLIVNFLMNLDIKPSSALFGSLRYPLRDAALKQQEAWEKRMASGSHQDCNKFSGQHPPWPSLLRDGVGGGEGVRLLYRATVESPTERTVKQRLQKAGFVVEEGGWHRPRACTPRETVAVVVPYRDRHQNLVNFLNYMHRFLQRQRRHYVLVVAEQVNHDVPFNRAKLFNAVVREVMRDWPQVECFVFHDVDKLPFHLFNLYSCSHQPRQLLRSIWTKDGRLVDGYYPGFLGGVTAFTKWQLLRINGLSNDFYGWGGEDDDLQCRARLAGYLPSVVTPEKVGRFLGLKHHDDTRRIAARYEKLVLSRIIRRMQSDGLRQVRYSLLKRLKRSLYTVFSFDIMTRDVNAT